jgi:hypothetical protein
MEIAGTDPSLIAELFRFTIRAAILEGLVTYIAIGSGISQQIVSLNISFGPGSGMLAT